LKYDGVNDFGNVGPGDLAFDATNNLLVGTFQPGGNDSRRFFSFDLFDTDVTVSSVAHSRKLDDNAEGLGDVVVVRPDGRYMTFYTYNYVPSVPHWARRCLPPSEMDGATAVTKTWFELTEFTGWYPRPREYPYTLNGMNCEGADVLGTDQYLMIRNFKNDSGAYESHLYSVGEALTPTEINAYVDLGDVMPLEVQLASYRVAYGITIDQAASRAYLRFGQHNNIGNYNSVLVVDVSAP
jgi:hypothetical protein